MEVILFFSSYYYFSGALSIINYPHNLTVNETGDASFFCNATSFPPPHALATHITWSKLGDNDRVISSVQQLVIKDVTRFDSGTYICKAGNGLGLPATARASLDVLRAYLLTYCQYFY